MRCFFVWLFAAALLQGQPLTLVKAGQARVAVIHGAGDEYAAGRLVAAFRRYAPVLPAASSAAVTLYLGTLSSNPQLAAAAAALGCRDQIAGLPPEGYLMRSGHQDGREVILLAGGDRTGAIYAAADFRLYHLQASGNTVTAAPVNLVEIPKMKYRWFWNWDTRTNWDLLDHDAVYEPFDRLPRTESVRAWFKRPEAFLNNMKLVVDYMSDHKLNGLILWGFLRDNHGGVEAARALCAYANERGVRIIPGVGIDRHYGGFYHEGKHEFNLETRAAARPELRSMDKNGQAEPRTLCLELAANRDWLRRGFEWLYRTFPIGGVNIEFAEHSTCYNPACVAARRKQPGADTDFAKDLARIAPYVIGLAHRQDPKSWISYVTYGGFTEEMRAQPPLHVSAVPDYAICQWTLTNMLVDLVPPRGQAHGPRWAEGLAPAAWPEGLRPPTRHSLGYLHWNAFYTKTQKGFFVDAYREAARRAWRHGFEGLDTYGEESPDFPNVELSYLAFAEFTFNPDLTEADFLRRRVAPLYGGEKAARLVLEIASRVGPVRIGQTPPDLPGIVELAYRGRRAAPDTAKERWDRMIHYLENILPR